MMENEGSRASYAAAARSKATTIQASESVLDSWEEAAQDDFRSQELERSVEEKLGKMKQKQSGMKPADSSTAPNHSGASGSEPALPTSRQGESLSSADLTGASPSAAPIRILKRPQSSGHLPQHGQQNAADQSKPTASLAHASVPAKNGVGRGSQQQQQRTLEERAAAYAEARMRIFGVADQQIHDDLPVQPKLSMMPRSNQSSPSSNTDR